MSKRDLSAVFLPYWKQEARRLMAECERLREQRNALIEGQPSVLRILRERDEARAEVERLREVLREIAQQPPGHHVVHEDGSSSFALDGHRRCVERAAASTQSEGHDARA